MDAHNDTSDEVETLKAKLADLEDRNRRNNIKLRGVAETVPPTELRSYVQAFIMALLPDTLPGEVIVDRAHRLPKPQHLPEKVPRDVIARIHFFHVKDDLMRMARRTSPLPDPYQGITVYADLSQYTMAARKKLISLTKLFRNNKVVYSWGYPTKLLIVREGRTYAIRTEEEGFRLAKTWGLLPDPEASLQVSNSPSHLDPEWSLVK